MFIEKKNLTDCTCDSGDKVFGSITHNTPKTHTRDKNSSLENKYFGLSRRTALCLSEVGPDSTTVFYGGIYDSNQLITFPGDSQAIQKLT